MLLAAMSVVLPAQAVRKNSLGVCFEVVGTDPHGVNHAASFYHKHAANKLATAWIAEGWSGVMINPC